MCTKCKLIQVPHNVYPSTLNYDYLSGASKTWIEHCKYNVIIKNYWKDNGTILEIASNDGVLLKFFKKILKFLE